jgi:hypothetical protein
MQDRKIPPALIDALTYPVTHVVIKLPLPHGVHARNSIRNSHHPARLEFESGCFRPMDLILHRASSRNVHDGSLLHISFGDPTAPVPESRLWGARRDDGMIRGESE